MGEPNDNLHTRLIKMMYRMDADQVTGDFIGYKDEIVGLHTQLPDEKHSRGDCLRAKAANIDLGDLA
ncbi:MAG: hypothetical protein K2P79_00390 [Sphingomonas sp.]|nr:hypothetical protein [Sphingomonas sp.]